MPHAGPLRMMVWQAYGMSSDPCANSLFVIKDCIGRSECDRRDVTRVATKAYRACSPPVALVLATSRAFQQPVVASCVVRCRVGPCDHWKKAGADFAPCCLACRFPGRSPSVSGEDGALNRGLPRANQHWFCRPVASGGYARAATLSPLVKRGHVYSLGLQFVARQSGKAK